MFVKLHNASTHKYWELEQREREQVIRSGKFNRHFGAQDYTCKYKQFDSVAACTRDGEKKARTQLKKGFEPYEPPQRHIPYAHIALGTGKQNDVFRMRDGLAAGLKLSEGNIVLIAREGAMDLIRDFVAQGIELPNRVVVAAALMGKGKMIRMLVEEVGLDLNTLGKGMSALMSAAQKKKTKVVALLIELGADVDLADDAGITALHHAALAPSQEVMTLLIEAGADPAATSSDGRTPLAVACDHGKRAKNAKAQGAFKDLVAWLLPLSPALDAERAAWVQFIGLTPNTTNGAKDSAGSAPSSSSAFVGHWALTGTTTLDSSDDDPNWQGPVTTKADGGTIDILPDGTLSCSRWGNDQTGKWEALGDQLRVTLTYQQPVIWRLGAKGTLECPDFDEEHGARFVDRYQKT